MSTLRLPDRGRRPPGRGVLSGCGGASVSTYEVPQPILNSPFEEPAWHWFLEEGQLPDKRPGRRPAGYFCRDPHAPQQPEAGMSE